MTLPTPRRRTSIAGELYRLETQQDIEGILVWDGARPFRPGDIAYCLSELGNLRAYRYCLVRAEPGGRLQLLPGTEFGAEAIGRPLGFNPDEQTRKAFEAGEAIRTGLWESVSMQDRASLLLTMVDPGAVIRFNEKGEAANAPRFALVLATTGGPDPTLKLAEKGATGRIVRRKLQVRELENVKVLPVVEDVETSGSHVQTEALFEVEPGTILRFKPMTLRGRLGVEYTSGPFGMVERITSPRITGEPMVHLALGRGGELAKAMVPLYALKNVATLN